MNSKATYTVSELAQYLELKSRIEPNQGISEWYGAEISMPAEIGLGLECDKKDIYIHFFNPSLVMNLPLEQAKYFLEQQLDAIRALDPDYILPYKDITRIELLSSLPS
jgi:hypothetical protein